MKFSNCKIIAEIGWNHMGNMNLAKKMVIAAKKSGADFAKFQTWSVKTLKPGPWDNDGRTKIYKNAELDYEKHKILIKFCKKNKINFLTSIFNHHDVKWLKKLNLKIIKIPSPEINNIELLKAVNGIFKHVIVSTGAATWTEIKKVKKIITKSKITFLHCVSSYPARAENINLPRINKLRQIHKNIGYSGHLPGVSDAIASLSYGVEYIEKHFTTDNKLPGRDNKFALLPHELKYLVDYKNQLSQMNLYKGKNFQKVELDMRKFYRGRWSKNHV
tara:strand:- start:3902 stop:4723 length:822 start_codon:yes stop_codon:yes gene_type:complete